MTKEEIFKRLNEITSYFSFGRVLAIIEFNENVGLKNIILRSQLAESERLITSERTLLAGLWMCNVEINKNWSITEDSKIKDEIYSLMHDLHLTYKPDVNTPIFSQLKEQAFYEGDEGYSWQFLKFAQQKYDVPIFLDFLINQYHFNIYKLESTFFKIQHYITSRLKKRIDAKKRNKEYLSPLNAFTISCKELKRDFNEDERNIIYAMSFQLGVDKALPITDISDFNTFIKYPILKLPQERGFFFVNFHTLAISLNETPYYWLKENSGLSPQKIGTIRGKISEQLIYDILRVLFKEEEVYRDIDIRRTKSSNQITDIDILVIYNSKVLVFQIKSKRLTELSKQGNADAIANDAQAAVFDAYEQGVKCIECLKNQSAFYTLRKNIPNLNGCEFYNLCVTTEQYPTLASISYLKSLEIDNDRPALIAMSIYDLDIACQSLDADEFFDYISFRTQCSINHIYAINEATFLGAFIWNRLGYNIQIEQNRLSRGYALLIDHIIHLIYIKKSKGEWYKRHRFFVGKISST